MEVAEDEKYRGLQIFDKLSIEEASRIIRAISGKQNVPFSAERQSRSDFVAQKKFGDDLVKYLQEQHGRPSDSRENSSRCSETVGAPENKEIYLNQGILQLLQDDLPEEDVISSDEEHLAHSLKDLCNANGEERKETLFESASVILEMGRLYIRKSKMTKGMRKKLNLIKSATLLHGAKVRFALLRDSSKPKQDQMVATKLMEVEETDLPEFNRVLLASVPTKEESVGLLNKMSTEVLDELMALRNEISGKLKVLAQAENDIEEGKIFDGQNRRKIDEVRNLCESTTDVYVKLMQDIAIRSLAVMGTTPPCKFALAGLGSMARREITLHSDFEHVIVLEDNADADTRKYKEIKEYFRWFAVVFQVIIIGLGETFIRSIGVKSINDLSSKEKSKNWFLDKYTPVGVAFDGMVPHSCNNPLGRQEITDERKHVVELIQPAGRMAAFLTREEELKNGYYLKDVLSGTCFVFGNEDVYECFETKAKAILDAEGMNERIAEQLKKIVINSNDVVRGSQLLQNPIRNYDFKASTYRPITALLAYLARICNIPEKSSFDVVDRLHDLGIIDSQWAHALNFTVAVANEARMRVYLTKDGQRNASTPQDVVQMIGKTAAKYTYMTMHNLVGEITDVKCVGNKIAPFKPMDSLASFEDWDLEAASNFGFFEEVVVKSTANISKLLLEWKSGKLSEANCKLIRNLHKLQHAFMRLSHTNIDRRYDYRRKTEWACTRILILNPVDVTLEFSSLANLALLYFYQNRSKEGIEMAMRWFKLYHKYNLKEGMTQRNAPFMRFIEIKMREDVMNEDELIAYLINLLFSGNLNTAEKFFTEVGIASAQLRKGNNEKNYGIFCKGKESISELTVKIKQQASSMSRMVYQALLETIRDIQEKSVLHQHLHETAKVLSETQEEDYAREINFLTDESRQLKIIGTNIAAHADDHEYCAKYLATMPPKLQAPFEPALAAMLCQDVFSTSSYREMRKTLEHTIVLFNRCMKRMQNDPRVDAIAKLYGVAMMAALESSSVRDIQDVATRYDLSTNKVKYFGPLQPLLYGYISGVIVSRNKCLIDSQTLMASPSPERDLAIQMQLSQRPIMKSLTVVKGCSRFHKAFNAAVDCFTILRFKECARILWRIASRKGRLVKNSIHLLYAVILVRIVENKLHNPRKYLRKLREISHIQLIEASSVSANKFTKIMGLRFRSIHILYGSGLLVEAHNMAVDCHPISIKKCAKLLWMIVNYKNAQLDPRIWKASARCLSHVTYSEYFYHQSPNTRRAAMKRSG